MPATHYETLYHEIIHRELQEELLYTLGITGELLGPGEVANPNQDAFVALQQLVLPAAVYMERKGELDDHGKFEMESLAHGLLALGAIVETHRETAPTS